MPIFGLRIFIQVSFKICVRGLFPQRHCVCCCIEVAHFYIQDRAITVLGPDRRVPDRRAMFSSVNLFYYTCTRIYVIIIHDMYFLGKFIASQQKSGQLYDVFGNPYARLGQD